MSRTVYRALRQGTCSKLTFPADLRNVIIFFISQLLHLRPLRSYLSLPFTCTVDFPAPSLYPFTHIHTMAESISTQSAAGTTVFEAAPASLKDAPSEVTAVEKPVLKQNGHVPAPEIVATKGTPALPLKDAATHVNTDDRSSASVVASQEKSTNTESAPVQTTTGEPNGTNGVSPSVNGVNGTALPGDEEDATLFSPSLISPEVAALLPDGYTMRPLRRSDYNKGNADLVARRPTEESSADAALQVSSTPSGC